MSAVPVDPDWSRFAGDDYDDFYDDFYDWYDRYEWQDRFEDYDYDGDTSEPTAATDAEAGICTLCEDLRRQLGLELTRDREGRAA